MAISLAVGRTAEPYEKSAAATLDSSPTVFIVTRAPGMCTTDVESSVTNLLERRLAQAQGARQIESRTIAGLSVIKAAFRTDVRGELALAIVDALMHSAASELPPGSSAPLVMPLDFQSDLPVAYITVAGETLADAAELAMTRLVWRLNDIPEMGPLIVLGDKPRQVLIRLDPVKLVARHMTASDVIKAMKTHSPPLTSSVLRAGSVAYTVSLAPAAIAELSTTPLGDGRAICKLADVAQLVEAPAAPPRSTRIDGVEKVVAPIYATKRADAAKILDAVRRTVDDLNREVAEQTFGLLPLAVGGQPYTDDGVITIELRLPSGTRSSATEKDRATVEEIVRDELADDMAFIVSEVGVEDGWLAAFSPNAAECDATIRVRLAAQRRASTAELGARLTSAFDNNRKAGRIRAEVFIHTSASEVLEVRIVGESSDARQQIERFLAVLGAGFLHSRIVERLDAPGYQVTVDARKAADLGVTPDEVVIPIAALTAAPLASWTDGRTGARLQVVSGAENLSLEDLRNVPVATASKKPVPLGNLIQIRQTVAPVEIDHLNLQPVFRAQFVVDRSQRASARSKLTAAADKLRPPEGPRIELSPR
ncbi:MAG: efflux RND transporter permease subunit [Pirellulales bacterium]